MERLINNENGHHLQPTIQTNNLSFISDPVSTFVILKANIIDSPNHPMFSSYIFLNKAK